MDDDTAAFTQGILARARERQKMIDEMKKKENILDTPKKETSPKTPTKATLKQTVDKKSLIEEETSQFETGTSENQSVSRISSLKTENRTSPVTKISSHMPGSPQPQMKTLNIQKDNFNMEIKLISAENVRVEVEIQDEESDKDNNDDDDANSEFSGLREQAKYKLRKLGKLYSADGDTADISSPIQNSEAYFNVQNETSENRRPVDGNLKSKKGLSKLADLAQNIRQWEDDTSPTKKEKKMPGSPAKRNSVSKSTVTSYNKANASPVKRIQEKSGGPKKVEWDQGVINALESQGFTRTDSNTRLVYDCKSPKKPSKTQQTPEKGIAENKPTTTINQKRSIEDNVPPSGIQSKKALFESSSPIKFNKKLNDSISKDPSLLSLADRKALFEKNKGAALVPKAAFGMAVPVNKEAPPVKSEVKGKENIATKFAKAVEQNRILEKKIDVKGVVKGSIAGRIEALQENKAEKAVVGDGTMSTQEEIEMLRNRFNKNKNINEEASTVDNLQKEHPQPDKPTVKNVILKSELSTPERSKEEVRRVSERRRSRRKSDSPQVTSVLDGLKHVKVLRPKEGHLYPPLSDIETNTETEVEPTPTSSEDNSFNYSYNDTSEDGNTSFGREILQAVCKNQTTTPKKRSICDESSDSNVSDILDDMDDYLDEAMAHAERSDYSNGPTPPKKANNLNDSGLKQCNSFHYKSFTSESKFSSPTKIITSPNCVRSPRRSSDLPAFVVDGENVMPLKHTVSVYRKQQTQVSTPLRKVIHNPTITEDEDGLEEDEITACLVQDKIKDLTEEVNKQQMIISQTSRALNLCNSTLEFMGSTEQVEAEKLLLLATHRRQAALHEVQRLKVQGTLRPQDHHAQNLPLEKGTLTISNIKLPLKREYVRALAAAGGKGHHVICLVKSGEQVVSSQLVSTVASTNANADNDLLIRDEVKLENIYSDFAVTFEVYCLQAQEEILPHDVKYHINKKASNKLTPKKAKHESRLIIPPKESPAGPQAVRTSSFAMMGYVVFSIQMVNKTHFSLNNAPSMSPLEGHVYMKISCNLAVSCEHKGFLTMFEDVSGFGAWHRRWCVLRGDTMSYWKYPDHEKERAPIGSISLGNCVTESVGLVSRSVCARLNTIMLEMERESIPGEETSLTVQHKDDKTIQRYLLSADTKEERVKWCEMFNKALIATRMWGKK